MIGGLRKTFDGLNMYRLVLLSLIVLTAATFGLSFAGLAPAGPGDIALSLIVLTSVCWLANRTLAWAFRVAEGQDSSPITALILLLIMQPAAATDWRAVAGLGFVALWATASKYLIAFRGKHIFNPAALGAALGSVLLAQAPTWWAVSTPYLVSLTVVAGVLIGQKLRRYDLLAAIVLADLVAVAVTSAGGTHVTALADTLIRTPLMFFVVFMVTEPHTAPQMRWARLVYAVVLGVLVAPGVHFGTFYFTPEAALLLGNFFAFLAGTHRRVRLTFMRAEAIGRDYIELVFKPDRKLGYRPGQYMEWVVGGRQSDDRGNRRYLTLSSSPGQGDIRLAYKRVADPSAFKKALGELLPGDVITATQLSGSFVLPHNTRRKLAFIAGGIGITPFTSMVRYLLDRGERRDITLLFGNDTVDDMAYVQLLDEAETRAGVRTVHTLLQPPPDASHRQGFIDARMLREEIPDLRQRLFYISGPPVMVTAVRRELRRLGVSRFRIKTDFFPGLG